MSWGESHILIIYIYICVLYVLTHTYVCMCIYIWVKFLYTSWRHIVRVENEIHSFLTLALHGGEWSPSPYIHQGLFIPVGFTSFVFKVPCQYTPLFTLRPLSFGFTPFGWFISILIQFFFLARILFLIYALHLMDLLPLFHEYKFRFSLTGSECDFNWCLWTRQT